jgi:hypothetical protein
MFEKFDEAAYDALASSRHECMRLRGMQVEPEHLLLALTRDPSSIAARALGTMNVVADNVQREVEKAMKGSGKVEPEPPVGMSPMTPYETITFSEAVKKIFERSNDFRLYFGREKVAPEHLLLALVDLGDEDAMKILEELGSNLTFLRRQVLSLIAAEDCMRSDSAGARMTIISGVSEIVWQHVESMNSLQRLADTTDSSMPKLPTREEIVLMVLLAYLPDFLMTQTAYQRYLLEETLVMLMQRTGPVDGEVIATIVSGAAQNLRSEVRSIVEHLWTQEYRTLSVPDEAEHEEIGGIIEDLWWTYSEEIALHDVFDEALDDHRRKQVLNLQKRKLEIAQRLIKVKANLEDALKRCFLKRSMSA